MPSISFGEDFPILERVNQGVVAFMESMQARDVLGVAREIDLVFERCLAHPYASLSSDEQKVLDVMLETVDELISGVALVGMNNEIERIETEGKALKDLLPQDARDYEELQEPSPHDGPCCQRPNVARSYKVRLVLASFDGVWCPPALEHQAVRRWHFVCTSID
jgi:succinate dehydrogenase flavin-adding protein (antitoxin of CptAB toxin-antitoxin module)